MGTICAWCKKEITPNTDDGKVVSHGMCEDCKKALLAESARENEYIMNQTRRFG